MVNTDKLIKVIKENNKTQYSLAEKMGITYKTFHDKMLRKEFLLSEVAILLEELEFEIDPMEIFFEGIKPIVKVKKKKKKWYSKV